MCTQNVTFNDGEAEANVVSQYTEDLSFSLHAVNQSVKSNLKCIKIASFWNYTFYSLKNVVAGQSVGHYMKSKPGGCYLYVVFLIFFPSHGA